MITTNMNLSLLVTYGIKQETPNTPPPDVIPAPTRKGKQKHTTRRRRKKERRVTMDEYDWFCLDAAEDRCLDDGED